MTLKIKIIFLLIFSFFSCNSKKETEVFKQKNNFTVSVKNNTKNSIAIRKESNYKNISNDINIIKEGVIDIKIDSGNSNFIYISHKNVLADTILVNKGDSVSIYVFNEKIKYSIKSKSNSFYSEFKERLIKDKKYNYLKKKNDSITSLFYSINRKSPPMIGNNDYQKFKNYPLNVYRKRYYKTKVKETELFKSLKSIYLYKCSFLLKNKKTFSYSTIQKIKYLFLAELHQKLQLHYNIFKSDKIITELNSNLFINDSLLENPYSNKFILSYLNRNVIKSKPTYSRSRQYINYGEAYDNVTKYFNDSLSKYAKFLSIKAMINFDEPFKKTKSKFLDFKKTYNDKRLNTFLEKKYLFTTNKFNNLKKDVKLIDSNKKIKSLKELINQSNTKFIYIDFWASWCSPCRKAIPDYKKIINKYSSKNITFLYLSIDKNYENWIDVSNYEKINKKNSLLILNQDNSDFLKKINLLNIPRYIILDSEGNIINENAPGPKGNQIVETLDNLLNKN